MSIFYTIPNISFQISSLDPNLDTACPTCVSNICNNVIINLLLYIPSLIKVMLNQSIILGVKVSALPMPGGREHTLFLQIVPHILKIKLSPTTKPVPKPVSSRKSQNGTN